jgi:hypothetical protein
MPNEFRSEAKASLAAKMDRMVGRHGEYPPDRAARINGPNPGGGQGDAAAEPAEVFTPSPARQVSNYGNIRGK